MQILQEGPLFHQYQCGLDYKLFKQDRTGHLPALHEAFQHHIGGQENQQPIWHNASNGRDCSTNTVLELRLLAVLVCGGNLDIVGPCADGPCPNLQHVIGLVFSDSSGACNIPEAFKSFLTDELFFQQAS